MSLFTNQFFDMKFLRKLFGMKPSVGDYVAGHLDFGIQYFGVVLETNYSAKSVMPGAYVSGKKVFSNMWKGEIEEDDPRFFVPLSRLHII